MVGGPTRKDMGTSHGPSEVIKGTFKGGMITFFTNPLSNFAMTKDPDSHDVGDFDNQLLKIGIVVLILIPATSLTVFLTIHG